MKEVSLLNLVRSISSIFIFQNYKIARISAVLEIFTKPENVNWGKFLLFENYSKIGYFLGESFCIL